MFRTCLLFLLLASPALGQDPEPTPAPIPPVAAAIVAPKGVEGDGTEESPFVFNVGDKGDLRLVGVTGKVKWTLKNAPADTEVLADMRLWFPTKITKRYVVSAAWMNGAEPDGGLVWFEIKGSGPSPPPVVEDSITSRVKAALAGQKADADKFASACIEVAKPLEVGTITRLAVMESSLKAALDAVGWVPGKYPDLSKLAGELFGKNVPDRDLTADERATFVRQLRLISTACGGVK